MVINTSLDNQKHNALEKCLWFSRQPVIFKASLENQKARLENQNAYSVNCTGKFVLSFQDNLSLFEPSRTQIGTIKILN